MRKEQLREQFKECILSVVSSLQAGYAVENAFLESREDMRSLYGEQSFIYQELEFLRRGLVINITLEEQLADLALRSDCEEIQQFAGIFTIARKSGGNLPEIIKTSANLISQRLETEQEVTLLLAGQKMEQGIMKGMPFGILLYLGVSYPGYFDPLYHNLSGIAVMSLCLALYVAAYLLGEFILQGIAKELSGNVTAMGKSFSLKEPDRKSQLQGLSVKLYRAFEKTGKQFPGVTAVLQDLKKLYPEKGLEALKEFYYVEKITLSILLVLAGSFFSVVLHWKAVASGGRNIGGYLMPITVAIAVLLFFLRDRDLHEEIAHQKKRLKLQYPDVVHKLVLYLGAGMSIRGSFYRLAERYELAVYACRELEAGLTEPVVYDRFGKRAGVMEYIRLGTLLTQNLKKGNRALLIRLEEEAYKASKDRVNMAKKLGEEAGTKLLIPMVMYLATVMLMIMIPAFNGLGI